MELKNPPTARETDLVAKYQGSTGEILLEIVHLQRVRRLEFQMAISDLKSSLQAWAHSGWQLRGQNERKRFH